MRRFILVVALGIITPGFSYLSRMPSSPFFHSKTVPFSDQVSNQRLHMSDEQSLLEQMRKALGETEDMFGEAEQETKQLLQGLRDLDRDPNMKANNKFIDWLAANGVWVKQESAWGRAPHPLVISSNTVDDGESCGRGLLARETLAEGIALSIQHS